MVRMVKMVRKLKLGAHKNMLRGQGLFCLKNRIIREYITAISNSLMGRYREDRGHTCVKGTAE